MTAVRPFLADGEGLTLLLRVTPRASRTAPAGVQELPDGRTALALRVAAPPVDGEANAAVVLWASKALGVSRSAVTIEAGDASRVKRLRIDGDGAALADRVESLLT